MPLSMTSRSITIGDSSGAWPYRRASAFSIDRSNDALYATVGRPTARDRRTVRIPHRDRRGGAVAFRDLVGDAVDLRRARRDRHFGVHEPGVRAGDLTGAVDPPKVRGDDPVLVDVDAGGLQVEHAQRVQVRDAGARVREQRGASAACRGTSRVRSGR